MTMMYHHHHHHANTAHHQAAYNHYNASQFFGATQNNSVGGGMMHSHAGGPPPPPPPGAPMAGYYTPTVMPTMPAVSPITSTTGPEPLGSSTPIGSRRATKRSHSDDSSDDETSSELAKLGHLNDGDNVTGVHLVNRKKRRGMIEKRRRDRINNSLHELKRLVPAAFEKQGSAKLEKAEILQLTVDHLRVLHSKGFDAFSFDPQKFATDYHQIGFRECLTEVTRYLAVHEGLDLQDPMRIRLMTHLHNYQSQRELSLKSCTGWNPSMFTTPSGVLSTQSLGSDAPSINTTTNIATPSTPSSVSPNNNNNNNNNSSSCTDLNNSSNTSTSTSNANTSSTSNTSSSPYHTSAYSTYDMNTKSATTAPYPSVINYAPYSSIHMHHPSSTGAPAYFPTSGYAMSTPMMHHHLPPESGVSSQSTSGASSSVKPYRPWGTELAY